MMVYTFACLEKYYQGFFLLAKVVQKVIEIWQGIYLKKTIVFLGRTYCFIEILINNYIVFNT